MADSTTEKLILDVRRRAMLPNATGLGSSDSDILNYLNDALQMYIAPLLMSVGGEYLVSHDDFQTTVNVDSYPIPSRALGNKLRDVMIYWGNRFVTLQQAEPEQNFNFLSLLGHPTHYYIEGGNYVLWPKPNSVYTIRVKYYRRPSELVLSSSCLKIDSVDGTDPVELTVASGGNDYASVAIDVVSGTSPFSHKVSNVVPFDVTDTLISFESQNVIQPLSPGDWICFADTSPVAQIPQELYPLLAQTAALEISEALNNPRSGEILKKREIMKNQIMPLITPRSEGSGRVILNKNAVGYRYFRRFGLGYWR